MYAQVSTTQKFYLKGNKLPKTYEALQKHSA